MRELEMHEVELVSGGSDDQASRLITPLDPSNDMRYFCMTLGVGICIANGGGDWHGSARWGAEFRFGSGEARSSAQASQMARDQVESGGASLDIGFTNEWGGGQYQSGWGGGVGGQFGETRSSD